MTDVLSTKPIETIAPLYGRKWKVSVLVPNSENPEDQTYTAHVLSDSDYEEQALRVTFNIQKHGWVTPNFSEISVYNVAPDIENIILKNGMIVRVEAGYVNGVFGLIYEAPIFQPLWDRQNVVDSIVTFRCIDAQGIIYDNYVATTGFLKTQKGMLIDMAARARQPFKLRKENMSDSLEDKKLVRPKIFFDKPSYYIRKYAQQNGTLPSYIDLDAYITKPQDPVSASALDNALVISPGEGGLIGVPQQTQDGVDFTCLLNPLIRVFNIPDDKKINCMLVKIDKSIIRQAEIQPNQESYSKLDQDWTYKVIGVNHVGDTRGGDWYTKVSGVDQSMSGLRGAMWATQNSVNK